MSLGDRAHSTWEDLLSLWHGHRYARGDLPCSTLAPPWATACHHSAQPAHHVAHDYGHGARMGSGWAKAGLPSSKELPLSEHRRRAGVADGSCSSVEVPRRADQVPDRAKQVPITKTQVPNRAKQVPLSDTGRRVGFESHWRAALGRAASGDAGTAGGYAGIRGSQHRYHRHGRDWMRLQWGHGCRRRARTVGHVLRHRRSDRCCDAQSRIHVPERALRPVNRRAGEAIHHRSVPSKTTPAGSFA